MVRLGLFMLALGAQSPGPLDAYAANYAALSVDSAFEFTARSVDFRKVDPELVWMPDGIPLVEDRARSVTGNWGCDGTNERYYNRRSEEAAAQFKAAKSGELVRATDTFEMILDDHKAAWILGDQKRIQTATTDTPPFMASAKGSLFRWTGKRLPVFIASKFPSVLPHRSRGTLHGHPVEVEVYSTETEGHWRTLRG